MYHFDYHFLDSGNVADIECKQKSVLRLRSVK